MTFGALKTRTLRRLAEDAASPAYFSSSEVGNALNRGQRLFALLTLCLERIVDFPLTPGTSFYRMLPSYADWLVPLRLTTSGARVKPATLAELYALDESWRARGDSPTHYGMLGFDLLFVRGSSGTLQITYAGEPARMAADDDQAEIIDAYQPCLIDYAIARVRAKQGGQEFKKALPYFERFLKSCQAAAADILARSVHEPNDRKPFEISHYDPAKFLAKEVRR